MPLVAFRFLVRASLFWGFLCVSGMPSACVLTPCEAAAAQRRGVPVLLPPGRQWWSVLRCPAAWTSASASDVRGCHGCAHTDTVAPGSGHPPQAHREGPLWTLGRVVPFVDPCHGWRPPAWQRPRPAL